MMNIRPRRLRTCETLRAMVRETRCAPSQLIYPVFVCEGENVRQEIPSMPGQFRLSVDRLDEVFNTAQQSGIAGLLFFGIPEHKDEIGSGAWDERGAVQRAIRKCKEQTPGLLAISDVCLCEYTSHGHCGALRGEQVLNDETLVLLSRAAVSHARAGADIVAPSDMMDGRVAAIRAALDEAGFLDTAIMSYAVKYASAFYGPFRDAADSAPSFGDRRGYQMDMHNVREGIKEALLDVDEGADVLMVKPAMPYLDVVRAVKERTNLPLAAYQVSGEYAMLLAAAQNGALERERAVCESAVGIFRAGADILISYFAFELAGYMREGTIG